MGRRYALIGDRRRGRYRIIKPTSVRPKGLAQSGGERSFAGMGLDAADAPKPAVRQAAALTRPNAAHRKSTKPRKPRAVRRRDPFGRSSSRSKASRALARQGPALFSLCWLHAARLPRWIQLGRLTSAHRADREAVVVRDDCIRRSQGPTKKV